MWANRWKIREPTGKVSSLQKVSDVNGGLFGLKIASNTEMRVTGYCCSFA